MFLRFFLPYPSSEGLSWQLNVLIPYMKSVVCSYFCDPGPELVAHYGLMMIDLLVMKLRFYLGLVD